MGIVSRPGASAFFVSDGPISSNSGRNGGKNAGRNCVSALPQRAIPGSDLLRILAGITFHHRCQSKGLCLRSPARRLPRPLAPATVGVFRSYRRTPQSLPIKRRPPKSLPPGGFVVLNDTPVACQIRGPTRRETGAPISRRRQPPPTHCGAPRRNGRDLIIATRPAHQPLPSHSVSGSGAGGTSSPPNRQRYPPYQFREISTAKFALALPAPRDP